MANHKSALKRSRQSLKRYSVNRTLQSSIKNNISKFKILISSDGASKKQEDIQKAFSALNSSLSKAVKKGIIKKKHVSRKLSSFSKLINK